MKRFVTLLSCALLAALPAVAQQAAPQSVPPARVAPLNAEFAKAADEVLEEVSKLVALPVEHPLKKSIRTRQEIRDYVIRQMHEERDDAKRYADQKALEKFGLIPKGFDLDGFLVELLTEQIAGLYDPKGQEFYLADWISLSDQRMVIAHEMVHALQDQHFHIEAWLKAARPNDDALLARDAVLEGSAIAGMIDYLLREQKISVRDLPDLGQFIRTQIVGEMNDSPLLAKAPSYIRDAVLFPYLSGTTFTQSLLRASPGWAGFGKVFQNPPVTTQQILHPELYLAGVAPRPVTLPDFGGLLPAGSKKLDENLMGEFGLHGLLKQFLGEEQAANLAPQWAGDRYAIFEEEKSKQTLLVFRLRLESDETAARFFGQYSELLERKYATRRGLLRRPNFFSFGTDEAGVFLYCVGDQCLSVEGSTRSVFDQVVRAIGWPAAPAEPAAAPARTRATVAACR